MNRPEFDLRRLALDTPVVEAEEVAAEEALGKKLPRDTRGFYSAEYQLIGSRPGTFVGFACKVCRTWAEYGHKPGCSVGDLEAKT